MLFGGQLLEAYLSSGIHPNTVLDLQIYPTSFGHFALQEADHRIEVKIIYQDLARLPLWCSSSKLEMRQKCLRSKRSCGITGSLGARIMIDYEH